MKRDNKVFTRKRIISISLIFVIAFLSVGCFISANTQEKKETEETDNNISSAASDKNVEVNPVEKCKAEEGNISDNKLLYESSDDYKVITMYLTVSSGNEADGSNHTWEEINTYSAYDYDAMGVDRYKVEGILKIDETGEGLNEDSYGFNEEVPNVSIQVRGQTSTKSENKNYKIRIKDGKEEYNGQRTLNLNKHNGDPYRFINKLSYDLLDEVPELMSCRTQFVHLYVLDNTSENDGEYKDYGLYTMVEQINKTYLKNRNLDENGQLYKVTFFEWNEYDAIMMSPDDPEFDRAGFERYIEIKGDEDPTKLQETIQKIHNYNIPIEKTVEENFDAENICYWMAFNILIGNVDVGARNLFLYSPLNSDKFYFICWDMDASFKKGYRDYKQEYDGLSWENGMTQFLGLTLVRRMMKEEKYRVMLQDAIEDIYKNYVNYDKVSERVDKYKQITSQYLYAYPEIDEARIREWETYDELTNMIPSEVEYQYKNFQESMKKPWPFFVDNPIINDNSNKMVLSWGVSFDYNEETVTYDYVLARDYLFNDVICEGKGLTTPICEVDPLDPGVYYLKVSSKNESGYQMDCFDYLSVHGIGKIYGCYTFIIDENGKISPYEGKHEKIN